MKLLNSFLQKSGSFRVWRVVVNFWSFVFFAAIIYDFFNDNMLSENEILLAIAGIYAAALAIYSAEKEFRRWHHMHDGMHPGEIYAVMWTFLIMFIIFYDVVHPSAYHMPPEVSASYIAVISILAITRESKNFYKKKRKTRA